METKKIILPVEFITNQDGKASYRIKVPDKEGFMMSLHLNLDYESSVFLDRPKEGHLMVQEFWGNDKDRIYLEVDKNGHLLAVLPDGYDAFIDENGDFMLVQGSVREVTEGIGVMVIEGEPPFKVG